MGHRVQQSDNGTLTKYLWDEQSQFGDVVAELNSSNAVTASYVLGNGLISQRRGATTNYYLADAQNSTRLLTNASAGVTDTYRYSAFGDIETQTGSTTNSYLYTGQQFDSSTGLYSLRARYYDAAVGRFLSRDTYPINHQNPMELNRYVYAAGNPVRYGDPSGRFAEAAINYSDRTNETTGRTYYINRIIYDPSFTPTRISGASRILFAGGVFGFIISILATPDAVRDAIEGTPPTQTQTEDGTQDSHPPVLDPELQEEEQQQGEGTQVGTGEETASKSPLVLILGTHGNLIEVTAIRSRYVNHDIITIDESAIAVSNLSSVYAGDPHFQAIQGNYGDPDVLVDTKWGDRTGEAIMIFVIRPGEGAITSGAITSAVVNQLSFGGAIYAAIGQNEWGIGPGYTIRETFKHNLGNLVSWISTPRAYTEAEFQVGTNELSIPFGATNFDFDNNIYELTEGCA